MSLVRKRPYSSAFATAFGAGKKIVRHVARNIRTYAKVARVVGNTMRATRNHGTRGNGDRGSVSYNKSSALLYRSKKKRRKQSKFTKKVVAVVNKEISPSYSMLRQQFSRIASVTGEQILYPYLQGGVRSSGLSAQHDLDTSNSVDYQDDDVWKIMLASAAQGTIATAADTSKIKLNIKSMRYDYTFKCDSEVNTPAEMDLYECICVKDIPYSEYNNIGALIFAGFNDQGRNNSLGTRILPPSGGTDFPAASVSTIGAATLGVTLFENPLFCKYFKIVKVTKHLLSNESPFTKTLSCGPRSIKQDDVSKLAIKGYTKVLIPILAGLYQIVDSVFTLPGVELAIHCTKHIRWSCTNTLGNAFVQYGDIDG